MARSDERRSRLARRDRRRSALPWLLAPLVFPALGAVAVLVLVERSGGDFADWTTRQTAAVLVAAFVVPAVLSGWMARRQGAIEAIAWAVVCVGVQLASVVGVGFVALGLGPS